jgi:hypothetical protein
MSFMGRMYRQQMATNATKIQACVSGHLARNRVRDLRRKNMATKLQATWRGHVGRAEAQKWIAVVMERREEEAKRRRRARMEEEHRMNVLAQSAKGSLEVFRDSGRRIPDPMARGSQIIPSYMKEVALNQARTMDPKLDRTLLNAPEMGGGGSLRGSLGPSPMPARASDALGWEGSEPDIDPFPASLSPTRVGGRITGDALLDRVYMSVASSSNGVAGYGNDDPLFASPRADGADIDVVGDGGGHGDSAGGLSKTLPEKRVRFPGEDDESSRSRRGEVHAWTQVVDGRGGGGGGGGGGSRRDKWRESWGLRGGSTQILPSYITQPSKGGNTPLVRISGGRLSGMGGMGGGSAEEEPLLLPSEIAQRYGPDRAFPSCMPLDRLSTATVSLFPTRTPWDLARPEKTFESRESEKTFKSRRTAEMPHPANPHNETVDSKCTEKVQSFPNKGPNATTLNKEDDSHCTKNASILCLEFRSNKEDDSHCTKNASIRISRTKRVFVPPGPG